ncbi:hypothetical protein EB834_07485 [Brevibacterium aurantiacum]|uniref:FAD-dependent urate hydroxylase HpyO/Asp monooxygenase CreE-like FAD/NAD(P)-binding domain-containing protein n=2 Tax=Brevibacterium aurantiacum TaxID=273384 RepID=A0A2A3YV84_BREAU|nr:hypothetical protein CXR27_18080 [Brevibacterium aurantiacum]PCC43139.1 hypothetical protein CIK65_09550 [Brevibacterium aurantiacum]PCC47583.1 hypothetical protein CIK64_04710 [Brevibacterium aurantiacum]PCC56658.1 hypothetical protein CIK58_13225 [Brevibacterium aurantiacum]RCS85541.1 hypothetical protein CIK63_15480 [Brevibacterium aurantiacum]
MTSVGTILGTPCDASTRAFPMMRNPSTHDVDIAVLGSGASGTHGLLRTISELRDRRTPFDDPIRITVIDRDEQFHSGIPYGHRSGRSSLLISALESFLPDRERSDFISWLEARRQEMLDWARDDRTPDSSLATLMERDWILRHEDAVRAGGWDDLYLPRRLYGQYLSELVERTLEDARGLVEVDFVHADVNEVTSDGSGGVHLRERDGEGGIPFELHAHSVLLARQDFAVVLESTRYAGCETHAGRSASARGTPVVRDTCRNPRLPAERRSDGQRCAPPQRHLLGPARRAPAPSRSPDPQNWSRAAVRSRRCSHLAHSPTWQPRGP